MVPSGALRVSSLLCALLAGCGRTDDRPNVLLITLDTTRADRIGCYGNERIETPSLDRLAREGIRFENAFTAVPSTLPSHCSIMTGTYPARHGVHDNGVYRLPAEMETLAERLSAAGWSTAAFVSAFVLDEQFGLAQGFEHYDDTVDLPLIEADPERVLQNPNLSEADKRWTLKLASPYQRRAEDVTAAARAWLEQSGDEPFFLWVHYFDPHMDYAPPSPFDRALDPDYAGPLDGTRRAFTKAARANGWRTRRDVPAADLEHMLARYDAELAYTDAAIGRLFAALEARGEWDETLVLAVADHGEGFGEHGQFWEHNADIHDEVMRVPLLLKLPGGREAGRSVSTLARTVDVTPTVLAELGLTPPAGIQGVSLLPFAAGVSDAVTPDPALLQALRGEQAFAASQSWLGLCDGRFKLVLGLSKSGTVIRTDLYDLASDPGELVPVERHHPEFAREWQARLIRQVFELQSQSSAAHLGLDEATDDALSALGYAR